ncbi:MAG: sigma-54-dependent Fis family transcriptional regulator [Phaeodactylibacter sp.]|nr:sigma-54-dependent Fis family transcriptional regulator [Phaeodactylibacter sp.]
MPPQPYLTQIWLYSLNTGGANGHFQTIIDQIRSANIGCCLDGIAESKTNILLILDENTEEEKLIECIHEALEKECRVIILYVGRAPLPFFKAWSILGMGVEEVLSFHQGIRLGDFIRAKFARWAAIDRIMDSGKVKNELIGSSRAWRQSLRQAIEMACFSAAPVLILGESGTGKELVARLIHQLDRRPDKQELVLLDCTTIVPELSGSEFFGHEKGAFTNAVSTRDGAFTLADRGTLFLDEIGELPLRLQAELLRVIQEGIYKRVGSNIWKKTTFRLVSATNRDLLAEVEKGDFRQDLYYRIRTCSVRLPALRERKTDIPELAEFFLRQELKTDRPPPFSPQALHYLLSRDYPGNVRELKQLVARIAYRHCGDCPITLGDIPETDRENTSYTEHTWQENGFRDAIGQALADGVGLKDIKRCAGDVAMELAIEQAEGNLQEAAQRLGVSDRLVQGFWAVKRE